MEAVGGEEGISLAANFDQIQSLSKINGNHYPFLGNVITSALDSVGFPRRYSPFARLLTISLDVALELDKVLFLFSTSSTHFECLLFGCCLV